MAARCVGDTLRLVEPSVPFIAAWASRGKVTRAEPISAFYEQGRLHYLGAVPRLEDQMRAPSPWTSTSPRMPWCGL